MDARNTGALIAARRKALGLTQKQLAERLLVSDKAVSKWENGASYPEVTLLPPLAQTLGITVDELLAGAVRGEPAQETEQADAADAPEEQAAAPPGEAAPAPQAYLADRLGSADDKLLLASVLLLIGVMYSGNLLGGAGTQRNKILILVVFIACHIWHSKQRMRFAALGVDTAVSHHRERLADWVFGAVCGVSLALGWFGQLAQMLYGSVELAKIDRYHVMLNIGGVRTMDSDTARLWTLYVLAITPLFLVLVAVFALAYRRMTAETRFRPMAVTLPVLPALIGAGVIGWSRAQAALANMPGFGAGELSASEVYDIGQAIDAAGSRALLGAGIVIAVLLVLLLVLWRATQGRVPGVGGALMLAVYAVIWLPSNTLWLDVGWEKFSEIYATENIAIELFGLLTLLLATLLCMGIALLADSLRRKSR